MYYHDHLTRIPLALLIPSTEHGGGIHPRTVVVVTRADVVWYDGYTNLVQDCVVACA